MNARRSLSSGCVGNLFGNTIAVFPFREGRRVFTCEITARFGGA